MSGSREEDALARLAPLAARGKRTGLGAGTSVSAAPRRGSVMPAEAAGRLG